jgi:hypothetical protein
LWVDPFRQLVVALRMQQAGGLRVPDAGKIVSAFLIAVTRKYGERSEGGSKTSDDDYSQSLTQKCVDPKSSADGGHTAENT